MEQWEVDLRARLEKEIPEGSYQLGCDKDCPLDHKHWFILSGKGGYIENEVAFHKAVRSYKYEEVESKVQKDRPEPGMGNLAS